MTRRVVLLFLVPAIAALAGGVAGWHLSSEGLAQEAPRPTSLVEREEVHLVTLDLVIEAKRRGGAGEWHPASDIRKEQVRILVGGREMELDVFENLCRPPVESATDSGPSASAPAGPGAGPAAGSSVEVTPGGYPAAPAAGSAPRRFVLYFDLEHLTHNGRAAAFQAARDWAGQEARPDDEVMIVTAGSGLRIVRPLHPAADGLLEDLDRVSRSPGPTEFWAAGEEWRIEESMPYPALRIVFANMDYEKTRRSLENLRDVMVLFDQVPGVKNLLLFEETIRRVPGREYLPRREPSNVMMHLDRLVRSANERNVRIYPVHATGLVAPGENAHVDIDGALTHLASETGGRCVQRTNLLQTGFALAGEDLACSYRVAFRVRPRFSGRSKTITVRVTDEERVFRIRHRRTLDDPTREQIHTEAIRGALLSPSSARSFPVSVTATALLHHRGGARIRIEARVALRDLLSLPDPDRGAGTRMVRVEFGGEIVPVMPEAEAGPREGDWADVDLGRESAGFGRQAELALPPPRPGHILPDSVAVVEEFDVPPGSYRAVVVASDLATGSVAAGTADFRVEDVPARLGPIGLAAEDPRVVPVNSGVSPGAAAAPPEGKQGRIRPVPAAIPPQARVTDSPDPMIGAPAYLYYGVCPETPGAPPAPPTGESWIALVREQLTRVLECDPPLALAAPPSVISAGGSGGTCFLVLESLPASSEAPSRCRYQVSLGGPGGATETRSREFTLSAASFPVPDR